jgi:hypothetical protein
MKITDVVNEDITRRGFLQGAGAAAMAGAAGGAGAGQYKSIDTLNKDPDSIQKIWVPRMSDLESRCYNILKSFIGAVSQSNPEYARVIQLIKVKISLGDKIFHQGNAANAQGTAQISPTGQKSFHSGTITLEATVFWDAPDDTLAFILGHECGHLVMLHGFSPASSARDNEMEADLIGASLAKNIGYNRARFFQFLFNLRADRLRNGSPNDPHLEPVDRVKFLKQRADFELSRNSIQYIDSLAQQLKQGLAEGMAQGNLNEFSPIKPPTAGAFGGNKDYGQPTSSRYLGNNKFVLGTTNNYVLTATIDKWGLEWDEDDEIWFLDSPGAAHIADASEGEIELPPPREQRNQIHDLVTDYLNARNSADLQKVAAYYGHSADGEMATSEGVRVPGQQILGTKNRAKTAYYPTNVKPKVPKLDKPLTDQELARLAQLAGIKSK